MKVPLFKSFLVFATFALLLPMQARSEAAAKPETPAVSEPDGQTEASNAELKGCFQCMKDQMRRRYPLAGETEIITMVNSLMKTNGPTPALDSTKTEK